MKVQTGKFYDRWEGPYIVVEKRSDQNYVVRRFDSNHVFTTHINRMKKSYGEQDMDQNSQKEKAQKSNTQTETTRENPLEAAALQHPTATLSLGLEGQEVQTSSRENLGTSPEQSEKRNEEFRPAVEEEPSTLKNKKDKTSPTFQQTSSPSHSKQKSPPFPSPEKETEPDTSPLHIPPRPPSSPAAIPVAQQQVFPPVPPTQVENQPASTKRGRKKKTDLMDLMDLDAGFERLRIRS